MKKNHFELKNYVMATGVFILAVIAGILIFFECVPMSTFLSVRWEVRPLEQEPR